MKFEFDKPDRGSPIRVKLDGKVVGTIRRVEGGYQYYPKGARNSDAEVISNLDRCKQSIMGEFA